MKETIIFVNDLHKKSSDISTIKNYRQTTIDVEYAIIDLVKELNATRVVIGGDWYDRGYQTSSSAPTRGALLDQFVDEQLKMAVNGELYDVVGNHIRLGFNDNPEAILIQPNDRYRIDTENIRIKEPVFKTPDYFDVNGVRIHLMHYIPNEKNITEYKPQIDPNSKYNVAVFHTDLILPNSNNFGGHSTYGDVAQVLEGIDVAVCGHFHKPVEQFQIGKTTVMIPGSLTNVDTNKDTRHDFVKLPILEINDDGSIAWFFKKFDLLTNRLVFKEKSIDTNAPALKSLRSTTFDRMISNLQNDPAVPVSSNSILHIGQWMETCSQYSKIDIEMVKVIVKNPYDLDTLYNLYEKKLDELAAKEGV